VIGKKFPVIWLLLGAFGEFEMLIEALIFSRRTVQGSVPLKFHTERREEVFIEMQICPLYVLLVFLRWVVNEYRMQRIDGLTDSASRGDSKG